MNTSFSTALKFRLFRFLLVGFVNTAFSYFVYASMLFIGLNYVLSNFIAVIAGIIFSFKTQGLFVFRNSNNRLIGKFVICWAWIFAVNILFIKLAIGIGLNAYAAGALALPPITILAYLTQKFFVFRNAQ